MDMALPAAARRKGDERNGSVLADAGAVGEMPSFGQRLKAMEAARPDGGASAGGGGSNGKKPTAASQVALHPSIPIMPGNAGRVLTTDGASLSWGQSVQSSSCWSLLNDGAGPLLPEAGVRLRAGSPPPPTNHPPAVAYAPLCRTFPLHE